MDYVYVFQNCEPNKWVLAPKELQETHDKADDLDKWVEAQGFKLGFRAVDTFHGTLFDFDDFGVNCYYNEKKLLPYYSLFDIIDEREVNKYVFAADYPSHLMLLKDLSTIAAGIAASNKEKRFEAEQYKKYKTLTSG